MLKSAMELDFGGRSEVDATPIPPKKTYKQVVVGEIDKKVEFVEDRLEPSPFDYRDFGLDSIIASGNADLLNPVGVISDSNLTASDNISNASDAIDNFANVNYVEPNNVE